MRRRFAAALAAAILLAGCASDSDQPDPGGSPAPPPAEQTHPDVVEVSVERTGDTYSFAVTISSPYDRPARYADGWRILGPDQTVYGEHTLAHDHAGEQPFTRTQTGVRIPAGVAEVTVEGRDSRYGYGGTTATVPLPPAG